MVSATLSGTCPTTPGHCPSPRILFRIDAASDAQSIHKRLRRLSPTRPQAPGATAMRSPASRYLQKRQVIGGATPVFQIQRWGRQTSSGQWPGSCVGSTHDQLKLLRRSVRMRKTGLSGAGGDAPLVTRRWRLLCVAHCSAGLR